MTMPPDLTLLRLVRRAAGFIATRASTLSPGVKISVEEKWIWKPETPARVPAGARISAGKSGRVLMSLPSSAEVWVNWVPASCMPSPESPARRMVADSRSSSSCLVPGSATLAALIEQASNRGPRRAGLGPLRFVGVGVGDRGQVIDGDGVVLHQ